MCRNGDNTDFDLVAAADLTEPGQVHDGLATLGGANDGVVFIKRRDDIEAIFRKAGIAQQRTAKLACADQNGVVCIAVAQKLFLCPMAGTISMMPGTAANPAYRRIDVDTETGKVSGLF